MYKKLLLLTGLVLMLSLTQCATQGGVIKEMVGWWKFDETEGAVAKDASGKSVDAKLAGDMKFDKAGKVGGCLLFDGEDDNAFIEGNFDLPVYTIALWFKADPAVMKRMDLVSAYSPGVMHGLLLEVSLDGTMRYLHRFPLGQSGGVNINTDNVYKDGQWHHAAMVKTPEAITLFMDGLPVATSEETSTSPEDVFGISLGCLDNERALDRLLVGAIDDLRVYNSALSQDTIKAIMEFK